MLMNRVACGYQSRISALFYRRASPRHVPRSSISRAQSICRRRGQHWPMRFIFGEQASIDLTAREYFVSRVGAAARGGHEDIARLDESFTVRVDERHRVALRYPVQPPPCVLSRCRRHLADQGNDRHLLHLSWARAVRSGRLALMSYRGY
jgi:hypothetical protein